jgi:hypothetical protein
MRTRADASAALQHLQSYASHPNGLAKEAGQLKVKLQLGFQVPVAAKLFTALHPRLLALQSTHPCIRIKLPRPIRNWAVIKLQDTVEHPTGKVRCC